MTNGQTTYPLLPFSHLVWSLLQYLPEVYYHSVLLCFNVADIDILRFRQSVEKALRHHPAFSMVVTSDGHQTYVPTTDILHGQFHSIEYVCNEKRFELHFKLNRILGDSYSFGLLFQNVFRAYQNKPLYKDNFLAYLAQYEKLAQSAQYVENQQWYEDHFGDVNYPVHPRVDTAQSLESFGIEGQWVDDISDIRHGVQSVCDKYQISASQLVSLCAALAIMDYNDADSAGLTWAYLGRETMDEMAVFGSLHRDIPLKISGHQKELTSSARDSFLHQFHNHLTQSIAHSTYPYTLLAPQNQIWDYALNVLEPVSIDKLMHYAPMPFQMQVQNETHQAYSLFDIDVYNEETLTLVYRYSTSHYKPESISKFAALVRKYAEWLIK